MAPKKTKQVEHHNGTRQDTKPNRYSSNPNAYRVVSVHIESLSWPEEQDREEVGTGDCGNDQSEDKDSWGLLQASWEHGVLGEFCLPDGEGDKEQGTDEEGNEDVGRFPTVLKSVSVRQSLAFKIGTYLIASPMQTCHEHQHARDAQSPANEVNLLEDFHLGQSL